MDNKFAKAGLLPTWYRSALRVPLTVTAVTSLLASLVAQTSKSDLPPELQKYIPDEGFDFVLPKFP